MFDRRTRASLDTLTQLQERYPDHLWSGTVPVDTQLREASRAGITPCQHSPQAWAVSAYSALLDHLLAVADPPVPAGAAL